MEKTIQIKCEEPDDFRYWLERQTQDPDMRTFPIRGGQFSLDWPRVQQEDPLRLVMDGSYTYHDEQRYESHGVSEAITFELRPSAGDWMTLIATYNADMPAARTYFENLLETLAADWKTQEG